MPSYLSPPPCGGGLLSGRQSAKPGEGPLCKSLFEETPSPRRFAATLSHKGERGDRVRGTIIAQHRDPDSTQPPSFSRRVSRPRLGPIGAPPGKNPRARGTPRAATDPRTPASREAGAERRLSKDAARCRALPQVAASRSVPRAVFIGLLRTAPGGRTFQAPPPFSTRGSGLSTAGGAPAHLDGRHRRYGVRPNRPPV